MVADARWYGAILLLSLPATLLWVMAAGWGGSYGSLVPLLLVGVIIIGILIVSASFRQDVLLAFLVVNTTLLSYRVRIPDVDPGHGTPVNWQNYVKLAVWGCLILICLVEWRKIVRYWRDLPLGAFATLIGLYVVSASWSSYPALTLGSASGLVAYLMFGTLLVDRVPTDVLMRTLIWSLAAWCAANWVYFAIYPLEAFGDGVRFEGMSGHPNALGVEVAGMLCLVFGAYQRSYIGGKAFYSCLALGLVTLAATQSRTAAMGFLLAMALFKRQMAIKVALIALVALTLLGMAGELHQLEELFKRSGDGDVLAGRTDIWGYFAEKIADRPILGYGFNTFERYMMDDVNYNPLMRASSVSGHPHNNFFEVMFNVGIVGLVPYLVWAFAFLHRWWKKPDMLIDAFGLTLLIGSFTESNITGTAYIGTLVVIILLATDAKHGRRPVYDERRAAISRART